MTNSFHGVYAARRTLGCALAAGVCFAAMTAGSARADAAGAPVPPGDATVAGDGSEGTRVDTLIVTAERNIGAAAAPVKASVAETQPESIISHRFIEKFTPETGNYTTVVLIAPSLSGISSNGGGVGEYNKINLRGFSDGQYNITYDGIFYGDTNDPTHHPASFFPSSTIGAAVVDRGPGAAGDLGQANYGGAIHFFSPTLSETPSASQKATYGSFDTYGFVTTLQSGALKNFNDTKILLNFDERGSNGELTGSGGVAYNQLIKIETPLGAHGSITLFGSANYTRFFQADAGPGETYQQTLLYGKDFALTDIPNNEHNKDFNTQKKHSDFEYIDVRYDFGSGVTTEDQGYTYFYSNKTIAADDITGLIGGVNTSHPSYKLLNQNDIGGYNKGNRYRVFGDILRVNKDWGFGTLKAGGMVETSDTDRHNILFDLTTGAPDLKYGSNAGVTPVLKNISNVKTLEDSSWFQYQLFADFEIRPLKNLTITPGFKYVNFQRNIDAAIENSGVTNFGRGPVSGANDYDKPLYFGTINYRILPEWSVYAQYATGFLIPSLSYLQVNNPSLNVLQPQTSTNYQGGTVFSKGRITADADIYRIDISNLELPDPTGQFYVNAGNARYSGVEGEAAYAFPYGITVFVNGSVNSAKNLTTDQGITNAPKWTDAAGVLYDRGRWEGSVTFKEVGKFVAYYATKAIVTPEGIALAANQGREIGPYNTINASIAYDFGRFKVKLQALNLNDNRTTTSIVGSGAANDLYTYEAGREIQVTVQAKFQ